MRRQLVLTARGWRAVVLLVLGLIGFECSAFWIYERLGWIS